MLQLASIVGVWGLSVVTLLAAASLAILGAPERHRGGMAFVGLAWGLLVVSFLFGYWRLGAAEDLRTETIVRVVQPSVEQSLKWNTRLSARHVEQLISQSREPVSKKWILSFGRRPRFLQSLERRQASSNSSAGGAACGLLVTGAPRYESNGTGFNSLHVVSGDGLILETYDKVHLVPFGEYVPLGDFLGSLDIAVARGSLESGPGLTTLNLPGLPQASPMICYEIIFPGAVAAAGEARPGFLLNLTNDAWFGRSSGPYQHFASAKLRAVEEGLPLVRAANNGISAVVDPYGRAWACSPRMRLGC